MAVSENHQSTNGRTGIAWHIPGSRRTVGRGMLRGTSAAWKAATEENAAAKSHTEPGSLHVREELGPLCAQGHPGAQRELETQGAWLGAGSEGGRAGGSALASVVTLWVGGGVERPSQQETHAGYAAGGWGEDGCWRVGAQVQSSEKGLELGVKASPDCRRRS